jgi:hypothetical protein
MWLDAWPITLLVLCKPIHVWRGRLLAIKLRAFVIQVLYNAAKTRNKTRVMPPKRRTPMDNDGVDAKKSKQKLPEAKKLDFSDNAVDAIFHDLFENDTAMDLVGEKTDDSQQTQGNKILLIIFSTQNELHFRKMQLVLLVESTASE